MLGPVQESCKRPSTVVGSDVENAGTFYGGTPMIDNRVKPRVQSPQDTRLTFFSTQKYIMLLEKSPEHPASLAAEHIRH
jgi:hypothetical protein